MFQRLSGACVLLCSAGLSMAAHTPGDLNGDGAADILWRHRDNGSNLVWLCDQSPQDGSFVTSSVALPTVAGEDWLLIGRADFNGDDQVDIVFRNEETGANQVWYMNATAQQTTGSFPSLADDSWVIVGIADFNSDAKPDLLWRNVKQGHNVVWLMNDTALLNSVSLPRVSSRAWHIECAGDLTGDSKPDILWRNQLTGATSVWEMNGTSFVASRSLSASVMDTRWRAADVMDFTGDSIPDIVWRNQVTGANVLWHMNGLTVTNTSTLPTVRSSNWYISGMDDFSGKGRRDDFAGNGRPAVVWRHATNGSNVLWLMSDDDSVGQLVTLPTVDDSNWRISNTGDLNRDGKPDLVWRNQSTGDNVAWLMNGTSVGGSLTLPRVTGDWSIVGIDDSNRDGINDICWHNSSTGQVVSWVLDGEVERQSPVLMTMSLPSIPAGAQVVGVADYDSDRSADLFIRLADGSVKVWILRDGSLDDTVDIGTVSDDSWRVGKVSDFNDDSIPDLLWRHQSTGDNSLWLLDDNGGDRVAGTAQLPQVPDTNWRIED